MVSVWPGISCSAAAALRGGEQRPNVRRGTRATQYQAAFNEFTSQGYVLDWVSGYFDGGQDLYAAIWRKEPNAPAWEG